MNHFVKSSVAIAVVLGTSLVTASAFAGIANTRHNLGATGTGLNHTDGTGEICIFCHTPHGGDTAAPVPLWNKKLTNPANFTTYDQLGTSTLDAAVGTVGSVSLACLTCHDGTQAIDNIINAPGSGGFDTTGGGVDGLAWTWVTDGTLGTNGQFTGGVAAGNIWQIGTDLTNDHPVSMQYGGGGYSLSSPTGGKFGTTTPTRDEDFAVATQIPGSPRWYVENSKPPGATAGFDKWDFKLYTRDTSTETHVSANGAAFAGEQEPFVECGSCHDPHFETTTFLRMDGTVDVSTGGLTGAVTGVTGTAQSNTGSRVCLTCHTK
jgi:hypothetical protein